MQRSQLTPRLPPDIPSATPLDTAHDKPATDSARSDRRAGLLRLGQGRLTEITVRSDVPGAVLLIPTVLVAVLIRPGEHAMVTSMLFGVRALLLASAASALLAAGVIAADYTGATEAHVWSYAK